MQPIAVYFLSLPNIFVDVNGGTFIDPDFGGALHRNKTNQSAMRVRTIGMEVTALAKTMVLRMVMFENYILRRICFLTGKRLRRCHPPA